MSTARGWQAAKAFFSINTCRRRGLIEIRILRGCLGRDTLHNRLESDHGLK